jgi:hypothetical protein
VSDATGMAELTAPTAEVAETADPVASR